MTKIFEEIAAERKRHNEKWGEQNHPMIGFCLYNKRQGIHFPDREILGTELGEYRIRCNTKEFGWYDILMKEVCEAFFESDPEKQRDEMIQVAAVAVQIIEYLDRKIAEGK